MSGYLDPMPLLDLFPTASDGEVAEHIGVSRQTILRWRHGCTRLTGNTADRVALSLGLHPANVWGGDWWAEP